jgi:hypothetical protein
MSLFAVDVLTALEGVWLAVLMFVIAPFVKGLASAWGNWVALYLCERWKERRQRAKQCAKSDQPAPPPE